MGAGQRYSGLSEYRLMAEMPDCPGIQVRGYNAETGYCRASVHIREVQQQHTDDDADDDHRGYAAYQDTYHDKGLVVGFAHGI